ncbi:helix-turn-helix domain-containing protein [Streptococcus salivarius]|uniref:Helix-turn-helix domain-containing protein n=1 Tax=Streptococcus salivarius TaxID=1304 RepID=A0A7L6WI63_STRSL|nr:helix-turn-helix domain-containing protein [Streptococcus salivarius]QMI50199.1 helix-turn-helix domain-containing protein [Streptococcus salivarius]
MQVILPDEQIHQIQLLISTLIKKEIENQLSNYGIDNPYLNKKQTCKYLGISNNTLDSWIQQGLPSIRIGKTVRFNKQAIDSWLLSQN